MEGHAVAEEVRREEEEIILLLFSRIGGEVRGRGRDDEVGKAAVGEGTGIVEVAVEENLAIGAGADVEERLGLRSGFNRGMRDVVAAKSGQRRSEKAGFE